MTQLSIIVRKYEKYADSNTYHELHQLFDAMNFLIFWKCWKLCSSISEKCWKFIASKMLEIKSRHLTWGGPKTCLGQPLASQPTQAALREKLWNEKQQQILTTTNKCPLLDMLLSNSMEKRVYVLSSYSNVGKFIHFIRKKKSI